VTLDSGTAAAGARLGWFGRGKGEYPDVIDVAKKYSLHVDKTQQKKRFTSELHI